MKSRVTVGVAPSFKSAQRAAQRKEVTYYFNLKIIKKLLTFNLEICKVINDLIKFQPFF